MFGGSFWLAVAMTFLAELVLHWAPFPRMPRILAYALGVAAILIGCAIWLLPAGYVQIFAGLQVICIAAGLATALGYGIDAVLNLSVRVKVQDVSDGE